MALKPPDSQRFNNNNCIICQNYDWQAVSQMLPEDIFIIKYIHILTAKYMLQHLCCLIQKKNTLGYKNFLKVQFFPPFLPSLLCLSFPALIFRANVQSLTCWTSFNDPFSSPMGGNILLVLTTDVFKSLFIFFNVVGT